MSDSYRAVKIIHTDGTIESFNSFWKKMKIDDFWYENTEPFRRVIRANKERLSFDSYLAEIGIKVIHNYAGWFYYFSTSLARLKRDVCGKWMYFFDANQQDFAKEICKKSIDRSVCLESKCTDINFKNSLTGAICFYVNADNIEGHKRIIKFMMDNDLIRKTKTDKYYNISFKMDDQTRADEYGDKFEGKIKLADFIDLETGEFIK